MFIYSTYICFLLSGSLEAFHLLPWEQLWFSGVWYLLFEIINDTSYCSKKMKLTKKTKSDRIQQHFTKVGSSWNSIFFFGVTYIFAGHVKKKQTHTHNMSLIQLAQKDSSIFQQSVIEPEEHIFTQNTSYIVKKQSCLSHLLLLRNTR